MAVFLSKNNCCDFQSGHRVFTIISCLKRSANYLRKKTVQLCDTLAKHCCKILVFVCCIPSSPFGVEPGPTAHDRVFVVERCNSIEFFFYWTVSHRRKIALNVLLLSKVVSWFWCTLHSNQNCHFDVSIFLTRISAAVFIPLQS